jgi:hypothetical protein
MPIGYSSTATITSSTAFNRVPYCGMTACVNFRDNVTFAHLQVGRDEGRCWDVGRFRIQRSNSAIRVRRVMNGSKKCYVYICLSMHVQLLSFYREANHREVKTCYFVESYWILDKITIPTLRFICIATWLALTRMMSEPKIW